MRCSVLVFIQSSHMSIFLWCLLMILYSIPLANILAKELLVFIFLLSCVVDTSMASTSSQKFWYISFINDLIRDFAGRFPSLL